MLAQFDNIRREAHGYKNIQHTIRLATLPIMGQYGISRALRLFEMKRKNIRIQIIEQEERDIQDTITNGNYDAAIVREEIIPSGNYNIYKLSEDRLALFVHENHPYAQHKSVTFGMLDKESFMFMPNYTYIYQLCVRLCKKYNIKPNVVSCARIETIFSNIESARCSSLLMARTIETFLSTRIKVIPLEPAYTSNIVAISPKDGEQKEVVTDFIDVMIHYLKAEAIQI